MKQHDSIQKLVVEDNIVTANALVKVFEKYGIMNFEIVNNAEDFKKIYNKDIEFCIIDYILPDSTAEELIEFISSINHRCRIIVMSSYFTEEIVLEIMNIGAGIMGVKKQGDWMEKLVKLAERACDGVLKDRELFCEYQKAKFSHE